MSTNPSHELSINYKDTSFIDNEFTDNIEDNAETTNNRLSSTYSIYCTIFVSILILSTIALLGYSNSSVGCYVQVQIKPQIPFNDLASAHSLIISENVSPWTLSRKILATNHDHDDASNQNNIDINTLVEFLEALQSEYPSLEITGNTDLEQLYQQIKNNKTDNITAVLTDLDTDFNPFNIKDIHTFDVFSFTLASSIKEFWNSKAYSLAIIILLFSGAWPYIKLISLLYIWLYPLKHQQRHKMLLILDQLGKYSFIDLYVCIFMIVSFYLSITETILGTGLEVNVIVQIDKGITTFAVATLISMVFSMVFLHCDQHQQSKDKLQNNNLECLLLDDENNDDSAEILCMDTDCFGNKIEKFSEMQKWKYNNSYKVCAMYDKSHTTFSVTWKLLFIALLISNIVMCLYTIYSAPVRYDIGGLAGEFMDSNVRKYTIKQTADLLPLSTDTVNIAWFCVVIYYLTVIIAPIVISGVLILVWVLPMNYKMHSVICQLLFPFQAWNALDVFMIGTIAASVELDQVSEWIINESYSEWCGDDGWVQEITGMGCFSVNGTLINGTILMGCYVGVQWFALIYTVYHVQKTHKILCKSDFAALQA